MAIEQRRLSVLERNYLYEKNLNIYPEPVVQIVSRQLSPSEVNSASNAATLLGKTWASPAAIGSSVPAGGTFTTLYSTGVDLDGGMIDGTVIGSSVPAEGTFTFMYGQEASAASTDVAGRGQYWVKDDAPNAAVFTDDAGNDHLLSASTFKSYSFRSRSGSFGTHYLAGYYQWSASSVTLTIGGTVTQTYGTANGTYAAHAGCVASGAGGANLVLTVSGTSITDAGVRTAGDSEILVANASAAVADQYFETEKKWLGQITYTLTGAAGAFTFNYGLVKYEDFGNYNFTITDFEVIGSAQSNDSGFDVQLLKHSSTGWTYAGGGFQPGNAALVSMNTDHNTEINLVSGDGFAYKRAGLSEDVMGSSVGGIVVRVVTGSNNAVAYLDAHVGVRMTL